MKLYSTNDKTLRISFKDAVFNSLPQDKGLYMPVAIPKLDASFIEKLPSLTLQQIAFEVAHALLKDSISSPDLEAIIYDAINFDAPLRKIREDFYALELFHGPSLAFKDFGARFMSRVMSHFLLEGEKELNVLVATSGDTGGAVALGFLGVPNTRVTILYPKGKVSPIQELQLTTHGQNIRAIEIDGTFDDCQALVKQAFLDNELNKEFRLTSANSINIARLIPQTFYYFNAYAQLKREGKGEVVFSVPSGNFGNIGAGILAWRMGLPVKQFLAATNVNDTVPEYLKTGIYQAKPSVATLSNAMDVGNPSNWVRILDMFGEKPEELKKIVTGFRFTDAETEEAVNKIFTETGYIVCPHTAIAELAAEAHKTENPNRDFSYLFLATAHPCKFPDVYNKEMSALIEIPEQVKSLEAKDKQAVSMGIDFEGFKKFLLEN